ncbi:hypothetical protein, partial [Mixta sp.]|uniref:hypothetical protein n=1 Tax=Mixta sp. TaxID=2100765 RepID=UPI00258B521E
LPANNRKTSVLHSLSLNVALRYKYKEQKNKYIDFHRRCFNQLIELLSYYRTKRSEIAAAALL